MCGGWLLLEDSHNATTWIRDHYCNTKARQAVTAECGPGRPCASATRVMGGAFSTNASTFFPASTSTLCVLPLRTNGQDRFAIAPSPMPSQLALRLTEAEYQGVITSINSSLQPLSSFGVLSLLLPFLFVDVVTLLLLSTVDPWLILSPWDYPLADLLLPLSIEFAVIFCSFPLMAIAVNRRMAEVQRRVRELLDDNSRRFGTRGVSFQLKQGVLYNGAGTNLWVEIQVVPLIHVQMPVPVPVPTVCPVILPSTVRPPHTAQPTEGSEATAPPQLSAAASCEQADGGGGAPAGGGGDPSSSSASMNADASMSSAAAAAAQGANLSAQQVEYLRVLQENQLLRQYLAQCQTLIQHLARQQQQQQGTMASVAVGAAATAAPAAIPSAA